MPMRSVASCELLVVSYVRFSTVSVSRDSRARWTFHIVVNCFWPTLEQQNADLLNLNPSPMRATRFDFLLV